MSCSDLLERTYPSVTCYWIYLAFMYVMIMIMFCLTLLSLVYYHTSTLYRTLL